MTRQPDGWAVEQLGAVAKFATGRTPARANPKYWNGSTGTPWVSIADMEEYGSVKETKETITDLALAEVFRGRVAPAGTLLMSFKLTIGRIATLGLPACHNEAIISIYPRPDVDQRFLGYYLSQVDYSELQDRQVKGQTLNQDKIERIPVVLPPAEERKGIADVLDRVRHGIAIETRAVELATEAKHAAMNEMFAHGLRGDAQKTTEIGLVPQSWEVCRLGDVSALSTGTTPSTKREDYYRGRAPFIKTAEITNNRLRAATTFVSDEAVADYNLTVYSPGTVLMAMYGQGKTRGQVALLEIAAATTQNAAAIEPSERVDAVFLWHYLMSIYERLRGMGSLGHLSHLNLGYLRELSVPVPSPDEQRDIAAILDAGDRKVDLHQQKRAVLDDLFRALLHKLMAGDLRVSDLDLSALVSAAQVPA